MSEEKKIKTFFRNPIGRIVVFIVSLLIIVAAIGISWHYVHKKNAYLGLAQINNPPSNITNTPGASRPNENYVKTQNLENSVLAQKARQEKTSSVPTIVRPDFIGEDRFDSDSSPTADSEQATSMCPASKIVYLYRPNPENCSIKQIVLARQSGVRAQELRCQSCSCGVLHDAGYTAGDLKSAGFENKELKTCGFTIKELLAGGYSLNDLRNMGFDAQELKSAGFSAQNLLNAGFDLNDLKQAGYAATELHALQAASDAQLCNPLNLERMHQQHTMNASALQCGAAALRAAGFTASELKKLGFSPQSLLDGGFSEQDLKQSGFDAATLAGIAVGHSGVCDPERIKAEREHGVSAMAIRQQGCSLSSMKAAGFTASELRSAGFSAAQLKNAGFSAKNLHDAGFSASELKAAGFTAKDLKDADYSVEQLREAGFGIADLKAAGYNASDLKSAGFSAQQLADAGFSAFELKKAGFSAQDLKKAGFSAGALKAAGFDALELKKAGFSAQELRAAGFSANALKQAGYSASELKKAGFTSGDLIRAGFKKNKHNALDDTLDQLQHDGRNTDPMGTDPAEHPVQNSEIPSVHATNETETLKRIQEKQNQLAASQQRDANIQQTQGQMMMLASKLMTTWSNPGSQEYRENPVQTDAASNGTAAQDSANAQKTPTGPVIKAGTILFGVLDTSINSDESTPIIASITSGSLKDAKLLGHFTRVNQSVLVNFNLMNMPHVPNSVSVNIVAVDANTAHTALSEHVDNHYFLRYGSMFASSFLSGIAQAAMQSNTSTTCEGFHCTTNRPKLTNLEYAMIGLGQTGQQYAASMSSNFNTPPTVYVSSGAAIGLLLVSDLTLPQSSVWTSEDALFQESH